MFIVDGKREGITLRNCPEFFALEGTNTLSIRFNNVLIEKDDLLADHDEFTDYIQSIKPGFILLQIGIGSGITEACIQIMNESNLITEHMNQYLDIGELEATHELKELLQKTDELAHLADDNQVKLLSVLETRLKASELTLAVAQSASLHAGAKGYLMRHAAQRRYREALFVAIVTPAIKHLRQDIAILKLAS